MTILKNFLYATAAGFMAITVVTPGTSAKADDHKSATQHTALPSDADKKACYVKDLKTWLYNQQATGPIAQNAFFRPPNGSEFPTNNTNCDFYKWSQQMFLWLTNMLDENRPFFDGAEFFNVMPSDNGSRTLVPNGPGPVPMTLRNEKTDTDVGELAQAGSHGVLMSQKSSLVYYGITVNNLYAYLVTGRKSTTNPSSDLQALKDFPSNATEAELVSTYAQNHIPFSVLSEMEETLSMEMKTSWVDASKVDAENYVTMMATVPNYVANQDNTIMTIDSTKPSLTKKLALVGVHVVGTVKNHPEFVWATFEHQNNSPDTKFYYNSDKAGAQNPTEYPFQDNTDFTFMPSGGSQVGANVECAIQVTSSNIKNHPTKFAGLSAGDLVAVDANGDPVTAGGTAVCNGGIVASNTYRARPWGSKPTNDADIVSNNTDIISLNNSVISQLNADDIRRHYMQIGALWAKPPKGKDAEAAIIPNRPGYRLAGSKNLYNSTMETYTFPDSNAPNCFSCHAIFQNGDGSYPDNSYEPFDLSHIYSEIQPLKTK